LKVDVGTTLNQDVTLEVGGVAEHVEVTVHSRLVETASGAAGTTVEITQVLEMPLVDRNVFNLMNLVPGSFNLGGTVSLGGGRSAWPMVDGINDTRGGLAAAGIEMSLPVDSMQEFKVVVNSYGAEYGRSEGGMLDAVTKSGTNRFHGSLYEFLRNNLFDARGWGADVKPPLQRNITAALSAVRSAAIALSSSSISTACASIRVKRARPTSAFPTEELSATQPFEKLRGQPGSKVIVNFSSPPEEQRVSIVMAGRWLQSRQSYDAGKR